jgi:hypothetical protein
MAVAAGLKSNLVQALREVQLELIPAARQNDRPIPQRPLVRVQEAAELLAISNNQVRNLVDCGVLVGRPVGDSKRPERLHIRVTTESIRKFVEGQR